MKVILTDPKHDYDFVDIVLHEKLSYEDAYRRAKTYNLSSKWYRAAIAPDDYPIVRIPNETRL